MFVSSKRLGKLLLLFTIVPGFCFANDYDKKAADYIDHTHKSAQAMAEAMFVYDLMNTFTSAVVESPLRNSDVSRAEEQLQSTLNEIMNQSEEALSSQNTFQQNSFVLANVIELRHALSGGIATLNAEKSHQNDTKVARQVSLLNALRKLEDRCDKGYAFSPLNAGQNLPTFLKNGFKFEFKYSYSTDTGQGQISPTGHTENEDGDPTVIAVANGVSFIGSATNTPWGYAIAAAVQAVMYVYSTENRRQTALDITNAYLRTLNEQATSTDVKNFYIAKCNSRKSLIKKIISTLEQGQFPAEIYENIRSTQSENIKTLQGLNGKTKELSTFMSQKIKSDELIDLTLFTLLKITAEDSEILQQLQQNLISSDQYGQILDFLDGKIRFLQKANYVLSLLDQDAHIMGKIVLDKSLFIESESLIREWQVLYSQSLALSFRNVGAGAKPGSIEAWGERLNKVKDQLPARVRQGMERRASMLLSMARSS